MIGKSRITISVLLFIVGLSLYVNSAWWFRLRLCKYYEKNNHYVKAINTYRKILIKDDVKEGLDDKIRGEINFSLGRLYAELNLVNLAIESYAKGTEAYPGMKVDEYYTRHDLDKDKLIAIGLLEGGNPDGAIDEFIRLDQFYPEFLQAREYIKIASDFKGRGWRGSDKKTLFLLGDGYIQSGLFNEARAFFTKRILDYGVEPIHVLDYLQDKYAGDTDTIQTVWGDDIYVTLEDFEAIEPRLIKWVSNVKKKTKNHSITSESPYRGLYSEFLDIDYAMNRKPIEDDNGKADSCLSKETQDATPSGPVSNRTLNVGLNSDYKTIQQALDAALPGDTILVEEGLYEKRLCFKRDYITLKASGAKEKTIITANWWTLISFGTCEGIVLEGFTISYRDPDEWYKDRCFKGANDTVRNIPVIIKDCDINVTAENNIRLAEFTDGVYEFVGCNIVLTQTSPAAYDIVGLYVNGADAVGVKNCKVNMKNSQTANGSSNGICVTSTAEIEVRDTLWNISTKGTSDTQANVLSLLAGASTAEIYNSEFNITSPSNVSTRCLYIDGNSKVNSYNNVYNSTNANKSGNWAYIVSGSTLNSSGDQIREGTIANVVDKKETRSGRYDFLTRNVRIPLNNPDLNIGIRLFIRTTKPSLAHLCFNIIYSKDKASGVCSISTRQKLNNGWEQCSVDNLFEKAESIGSKNKWSIEEMMIDKIIIDTKGITNKYFVDDIQLYLVK